MVESEAVAEVCAITAPGISSNATASGVAPARIRSNKCILPLSGRGRLWQPEAEFGWVGAGGFKWA